MDPAAVISTSSRDPRPHFSRCVNLSTTTRLTSYVPSKAMHVLNIRFIPELVFTTAGAEGRDEQDGIPQVDFLEVDVKHQAVEKSLPGLRQ